MTGENGGAAFVLIYLGCVILIGVPVMIAELSIGRRTLSDPVGAFKSLAPKTWWKAVGALGVVTGFMILSAYSVVAGWTLRYIFITLSGQFSGSDQATITRIFEDFTADGYSAVFFQFLFMAATIWIVRGWNSRGY